MSEGKKYTKFEKDLRGSSEAIRGQRATFAATDAKESHAEMVREIEARKRKKLRELMKLEDLQRESTTSLQVVRDSFDSDEWVKSIQELGLDILEIDVELKVAQATAERWFTEDQTI